MPDAPTRVERVLNLLALLLDTRRPLTREEIVREVAGYPPQTTANRRAFERDKETLRGMGVPITMESIGDSNEEGYRVRPDDYYLPDLGFTAAETAALRIAVSAVSLGNEEGVGALMKLGGLAGDAAPPIASLPIAPALASLFDAFRRRAVVTFTYRGERRTVEPWGLTSKRGRWYLVGMDRDRGALRAFRADRVDDDVEIGASAAFTIPDDFRPGDHVEARPLQLGDDPPVTVRVEVDNPFRDALTDELGTDTTIVAGTATTTTVELAVTNLAAFRASVLAFTDHAEIVEPPEVRADIVAWLDAIATGAQA
jgi:proteasome accessory factor B